jgi:uncharacterized protein (DUF433 family)
MSQALVDIGCLIVVDPEHYNGCPVIATTGTSVRQIVALYKQGYSTMKLWWIKIT